MTIEPINQPLKRAVDIPSFQQRYEMMRRETLENADVQAFLAAHAEDITMDMVNRSLPKLFEYSSQKKTCCGCSRTADCTNYLKGFVPKLYIIRDSLDIEYTRCEQKIREDERRNVQNMVASMHMSKDVLTATLSELVLDNRSRLDIANLAADFVQKIRETGQLPTKGFYLHGEFGVGKSFVLGAIANELASLKIQSVVVFVPEFLREMKNAISDHSLHEKIDYVKKAPVLMLDDLGAETLSSWTRDEIIGTILHYRMAEQLPTFITSNFDYDGLEHHLATTQKGDIEVVKAARIMERIKAVTIPIQMGGGNRRL